MGCVTYKQNKRVIECIQKEAAKTPPNHLKSTAGDQNICDIDQSQQDQFEEIQMQTLQNSQNSRVFKLPKKQNNPKNKVGQSDSTVNTKNQQEFGSSEYLEGAIREQNNYSTIMIYNSKVFMQFTLPKHKAGPIIVPIISYSSYVL